MQKFLFRDIYFFNVAHSLVDLLKTNEMEKILSVIVPTYNMENYLRSGLDSLLISKNLELLEIIVVNDGSSDNSSKIAHEYADKYPKVFVVVDKSNGNYGSCINVGLKIATGKYVKVLDADDSYITQNFEILVNKLLTTDADIVFSDYIKFFTSGKILEYKMDLPVDRLCKIEDVYKTQAFYNIQLHAITYKTELLKQMNYHQTEGISYTDMEWVLLPVTQVRTVYYINVCVYRYLMGREGQTMDPNVLNKAMPQKLKCFSALLNNLYGVNVADYMKIYTSTQLIKHARSIYDFYLIQNPGCDVTLLEELDAEFKVLNPIVYKQCEEFHYRLHIPYLYVKTWRKTKCAIPLYIRLWGRFLDVLGSIHVKFFMNYDPNDPR